MSLADRIRQVMAIDPAAVEIDFRGRPITWGSIAELVDEIEGLLRKGGVAPGAPVGLLLRNRPEMFAAILSAVANERCIVCINPMRSEAGLAKDLDGLGVGALVAVAEDWESEASRAAASRARSTRTSLGVRV